MSIDDILINEDINRLIEILRTEKRIEFDALANLMNLSGERLKQLKKWLLVLEDEGYVKLEYKLKKTYITWVFEETKEQEIVKGISKSLKQERGLKKKKRKKAPKKSSKKAAPKKGVKKQVKKISPQELKGIEKKLNEYSKEIDKLRKEIGDLEHRKKQLYVGDLLKLEKKGTATFQHIIDKILKMEEKIIEIKKSLKEIPIEARKGLTIAKKAEDIKKDALRVLDDLKADFSKFKLLKKDEKKELRSRINELKAFIEKEGRSLKDLEKEVESIAIKENNLRSDIERAFDEIKKINKLIESATKQADSLRIKRLEITEKLESGKALFERRVSEFNNLLKGFEQLEKVEDNLAILIKEYESKLLEIDKIVSDAERDLETVHREAEREAMQKYLDELEKIVFKMEDSLKRTHEEEMEINKRIEESRQRLRELISESRDLIRTLREKEPSSYSKVKKTVSSRIEKVKEKTKELKKKRKK